jgi:hypothetical protein
VVPENEGSATPTPQLTIRHDPEPVLATSYVLILSSRLFLQEASNESLQYFSLFF